MSPSCGRGGVAGPPGMQLGGLGWVPPSSGRGGGGGEFHSSGGVRQLRVGRRGPARALSWPPPPRIALRMIMHRPKTSTPKIRKRAAVGTVVRCFVARIRSSASPLLGPEEEGGPTTTTAGTKRMRTRLHPASSSKQWNR